ncbi:MAG TPA: DUF2158 domain-containing protein [Chthoniobacterales bacterium]|nr:DUF2158 domain-containing protein [Chthoniobacterales bacterium]
MKNEFTVGDIVQLRSGGPDMTVEEQISFAGQYRCQWFGGKKLETGCFPPESLIKVTSDGKETSAK